MRLIRHHRGVTINRYRTAIYYYVTGPNAIALGIGRFVVSIYW